MENKMFKYANGRYINPTKILTANVYQKDDKYRVAIDIDVKEASKNVVYSDTFETAQAAESFIIGMPVGF